MPVVSDFTIIKEHDFVSRGSFETKSYTFNTGGRHNSNALLDVSLFGGFRNSDQNMTVRMRINNVLIGSNIIERWQSHSTIVHNRINLVIDPNILRSSGNNTLRIEPQWESSNDYLFVGPIVCHFHQSA